jgi:hypothetical protein
MSSSVNFYPNERVDLKDLRKVSDSAADFSRAYNEGLWYPFNGAEAGFILRGFGMSQPDTSVRELRIENGTALLSLFDGVQIQRGYMVTESSQPYYKVDLSALPAGEFGIWVSFYFEDVDQKSRVFWDATSSGEFSQFVATRKSGQWQAVASATNPGSEYLRIATVTLSASTEFSITDERSFFFEGKAADTDESGPWAPQWGSAADRTSARQDNPVSDLKTFSASIRAAIEDIKGTRWWLPVEGVGPGTGGLQSKTSFSDLYVDMVIDGFTPSASGTEAAMSAGIAYVEGKRLVLGSQTQTLGANKAAWVDIKHADDSSPPSAVWIIEDPGAPEPPVTPGGSRVASFKSDDTGSVLLINDLRQLDLRVRYPKGERARILLGTQDADSRGSLELTPLGGMTVRTNQGSAPVEFVSHDESGRGISQFHGRGTLDSPQPVLPNDVVGGVSGHGYTGSDYDIMAQILMQRDEQDGAPPSLPLGRVSIRTNSTEGSIEAMRVSSNGRVRISSSPDAAALGTPSVGLEMRHDFDGSAKSPGSIATVANVVTGFNVNATGHTSLLRRVDGDNANSVVGARLGAVVVDGKSVLEGRGAVVTFVQQGGGPTNQAIGLEVGIKSNLGEPQNRIVSGAGLLVNSPTGNIDTYTGVSIQASDPELPGFALFSADARRSVYAGPLQAERYNDNLNIHTGAGTDGGSKAVCIRLPKARPGAWPKGSVVSVQQGVAGVATPFYSFFGAERPGKIVGVLSEDAQDGDEFCMIAVSGVAPVRLYQTAEYGSLLRGLPGTPFFTASEGTVTAVGNSALWDTDNVLGMCLEDASTPLPPDDPVRTVLCLVRPQFGTV